MKLEEEKNDNLVGHLGELRRRLIYSLVGVIVGFAGCWYFSELLFDIARMPIAPYLDGADVLIVTGESESMLAEAASLGKPVYIIPLPENPPNWKIRLNEAIVRRAESRPLNKRGTTRPQQGIERFCARLIRSGLVQPRRNLSLLHDSLIKSGIARPFGEPIENGLRPQLREVEHVAQKTKSILGIFDQENV